MAGSSSGVAGRRSTALDATGYPPAVPEREAGRRPLRVLFLIRGLGPGGAEHLLVAAAKTHDPQDFVLEAAYLLPWKDVLVPDLEALGVRTHCLGVRSPADLRWLVRLARLVYTGRFDVVHVHSPIVAGLARPLLRLVPSPRRRPGLVYTEHNRWSGYHPGTRWLNRLTYGLDDAHLAVSEDSRDSVAARFRGGVEVTVQGIALERVGELRSGRSEVRAELGVGDDDVVVVTVANLRLQKAYPDLLAAAKLVLRADPKVVWLSIGQGPLEAELKDLARALELGCRFRFLGHCPDAIRLVAGCDVFSLASTHEGYPVAVMEALALGVPVVATAVGGVPQAVEEGVGGLVVPPARPELLAAAILRVTKDPELRSMLAAGALQAGQRYDIGFSVRRNESIYRHLASRRSAF